MPRHKSYKAESTAEVYQLHSQPFAKFKLPQKRGRAAKEVILDFSIFGFRQEVAVAFAAAYQVRYSSSSDRTLTSLWKIFSRKFTPWLKSVDLAGAPLKVIVSKRTRDLFHLYVKNHDKWNANTSNRIFNTICNLFEQVTSANPGLDFVRRLGHFEVDQQLLRNASVDVIPDVIFKKIRRVLMSEIRQAWIQFEEGQRALSYALANPHRYDATKPEPTLEGILYSVSSKCNGIAPGRDRELGFTSTFRKACDRYFKGNQATQLVKRFDTALDCLGIPSRNHGRMRAVAERYSVSVSLQKNYGTGASGALIPISLLRQVAKDAKISLNWLLTGEGLPGQEDSTEFKNWAESAKSHPKKSRANSIPRYLYATTDAICAYIAFLATETGANTIPMLEWPLDILKQNIFMQNVYTLKTSDALEGVDVKQLSWEKGRSTIGQKGCFADVGTWGPINLIRQVIQMTEPIRHLVPDQDKGLLFVAFKESSVKGSDKRFGRIVTQRFAERMAAIALKHNIPRQYLTHRSIRATVLSNEYRSNRGLAGAQALGNHISPKTTDVYLDNIVVRKDSDELVGKLQHRLFDGVLAGDLSVVVHPSRADPQSDISEEAIAGHAIESNLNVTLAGGVCRDVRGGFSPSSKSGEICPNWWSCFGCPGAIFVPIPRFVARWLQMRDHFESQRARIHPRKWRELYEPKLILARERLGRVPSDVMSEARALVDQLPALPDLE